MREVLNMAGKLLLFTLVAALLLAGTNLITKEPIEQQQTEAAQAAQRGVLPEADTFEEIPLSQADQEAYPLIDAVYQGTAGDQVVGYVLTASPTGYGGPIPITLGVGTDGSIHGVEVGDLQETSGLGSRVGEAPFLSQFDALAADPEVVESNVDTISGVTVSSAPFKEAVKEMTSYTENVLGVEPHAGQPSLSSEDLARQEQLPLALQFEQVDPFTLLGDYDTIQGVYQAMSGDEIVGYSFDLAPQGYVDAIGLRLAIDNNGDIVGLTVVSNHESEAYGQRISTEPEFIDSFIGKSATAEAIAGVDALSGATGTSDAVKKAVTQAVNFYHQYLAGAETATPAPDAASGASEEAATATPAPTPDASSGATQEQGAETPAPTETPATDADSEASVTGAAIPQTDRWISGEGARA